MAPERYLLCLDFGTSSIKGGLIARDGRLMAWEREGLLSDPAADLERWQPALWVRAFARIVARLARSPNYGTLLGIVISGNGPTIVPVDQHGNAMGEALLWIDRRERSVGQIPSFFLPKVKWMQEEEPRLYEETAKFVSFPEYLNLYLTGVAATITPSEAFTPYIWTDRQIEGAGMDSRKFPPFVRVGERIGAVTARASEELGLPVGTPVIAGGSDFLMSLLGTATVVPGRTCDRAGTSEGINHCRSDAAASPRIRCLPHVVDGLYNAAGILASTGRIFEWFRDISGQHGKDYREMMGEIVALGHDRSVPRFFPSLHVGEVWEFSDAVFSQLNPQHHAVEMGRAVVSSIGFGVRDLIETLEANGCRIDELRTCGGQARNEIWNQMKADITGKAIVVPEVVDAELVGDACAGMVGLGEFSELAEASEAMVRFLQRFEPRAEEHERYTEEYTVYERFCRQIVGLAGDPTERGR